ncbi:hypothetical protein JCM11251_000714 [Rhodosporidiobolus azoricus]
MTSGSWSNAGAGFGPTPSTSRRQSSATPSTSGSRPSQRGRSTSNASSSSSLKQTRLLSYDKTAIVTPRDSPVERKATKSTQSKLSFCKGGGDKQPSQKRPPLATKENGVSSSSAAQKKGKARAVDRDDYEDETGKGEEQDEQPVKKPAGWIRSIFGGSSTKSPTSAPSSTASKPHPGIGARILSSTSSTSTTRRGPQITFSDEEDGTGSGEDSFAGEAERRKRRRVDKGGWGKLDLCEAEDGLGGMGSQGGLNTPGKMGGGRKSALDMAGDELASEDSRQDSSDDDDCSPEPSTLYSSAASRPVSSRPSARPHPPSSPASNSSTASSTTTAEKLQAQLVPTHAPVLAREPVVLVPDSDPPDIEELSEEEEEEEEEEEDEAVLESLVQRFPRGAAADDSGFVEVGMDVDLADETNGAASVKQEDSLPEAQTVNSFSGDVIVLSSSSPAAALPSKVVELSFNSTSPLVAAASSSPVRAAGRASRPSLVNAAASSDRSSSLSALSDSPTSAGDAGSSSSSGSGGANALGRTASSILMPPPPVPTKRLRLKRGAPSTREAEEEAEQQKREEKERKAREKVEKDREKVKKRAKVLVEDTQLVDLNDPLGWATREPCQAQHQHEQQGPRDIVCDETQTQAPFAFPLPPPPPVGSDEVSFFHPSASSLPLPTPRPLENPISSPERFVPTQVRGALFPQSTSPFTSTSTSLPAAHRFAPPPASAPADLSSPLRPAAGAGAESPVGLVAKARSRWDSSVQSAWAGSRPLPPPPPPEARQTKLGEFFLRPPPMAGGEGAGEEDEEVEESQGMFGFEGMGMGLEEAAAFGRALQAQRERRGEEIRLGGKGVGTILEGKEEIVDGDAVMQEANEEAEEIPDSDPEDDAPSFILPVDYPPLPAADLAHPPSSPSSAISARSRPRSTTSASTAASAEASASICGERKTRVLPVSPLGTPVKARFPRYSPGKMRVAVERFSVATPPPAPTVTAHKGKGKADQQQEARSASSAQERAAEDDEQDDPFLSAPPSAQKPLRQPFRPSQDKTHSPHQPGPAANIATEEETQWESYWSYPSSSPDPLALPSASGAPIAARSPLLPSATADAPPPPTQQERQQALLDRLLASTSRQATKRKERELSSSLSPLPPSQRSEEEEHGDEELLEDSDDESLALPLLPPGWGRDATGSLVKLSQMAGMGRSRLGRREEGAKMGVEE